MSVPMVKIGQVLFPGNRYRLLAPESALELDDDGGTVRLTELELLEFVHHGRARDVGVFRRENGELVEIPAHAFDPRPASLNKGPREKPIGSSLAPAANKLEDKPKKRAPRKSKKKSDPE